MAKELFEGTGLTGKVLSAEVGADGNGNPRGRAEIEVTEGEHKGKRASWSGKINRESAKYTFASMRTMGWQGKDVNTFSKDATGQSITFDAEIAEHSGRQWTSARIGGAAPLAPLDNDKLRELNRWAAEEGAEAGGSEDGLPF